MDFGLHSFRIRPLETTSLEEAVKTADKLKANDDFEQAFSSSERLDEKSLKEAEKRLSELELWLNEKEAEINKLMENYENVYRKIKETI